MSSRWRSADGTTTVDVINIELGPPPARGQRVPAPGDGLTFQVCRRGFTAAPCRTATALAAELGDDLYAELLDALGIADQEAAA